MSVVIIEGKIEEFGDASVTDGEVTSYSFIKIGGKRVRKIVTSNLINSMLKPNAVVRLACAKSFGSLVACAVQESDGEVTQDPASSFFGVTLQIMFISALALGIPACIVGAMSNWFLGTLFIIGSTLAVTILFTRKFYRARKALNGKPAPVAVHVVT